MKCFIIDTLLGIFAIDELGTILNYYLVDEEPSKIVNFYDSLNNGILIEGFSNFMNELVNSGFDEVIFDKKSLAMLVENGLRINSSFNFDASEFSNFRMNLQQNLKSIGFEKSGEDLKFIVKTVNEELIKRKISESGAQNDILIIQTIETLDIIKKSLSLFSNRLREWYGLHFPELTDKLVEDNIFLAKMVKNIGNRTNFTLKTIFNQFELSEERVMELVKLSKDSMGSEINVVVIQGYANQIISLDIYREELEKYLEELMIDTAPNLTGIVGSLIGAKLIAKAGSLKKLAFMPASRIQLLGAEKALYRFLKSGEKRPKHGLIFQWNQIRAAKPFHRGKISRLIAGKIGIAAKLDHFKGEDKGENLIKEIERKIKEIEKKYPKPPRKEINIKKQKKTTKKVSKKKPKREE